MKMDRSKPQTSGQENTRSVHLSRVMPHLLALFITVLISACAGGSGSSGFDVSPSAENDAINLSLATKQCLPGEELTICPANETALDVPVPGATPAPEGVDVGTRIDSADFGQCANSTSAICRIPVMVNVAGLTPGAAYQVAARGFDPLSSWVIADTPAFVADGGLTSFTSSIEVPRESLSIQVAVLVFIDGHGTTAGEILTLTETGADFAFVTAPALLPP
jgi:hypothetical protein